jgi:hypothetical protein
MAADILERPPSIEELPPPRILELQPGMTKIVPVPAGRQIQAIVIGNPNIADASAINLRMIAITGKGPGLTNFILFDQSGDEISNTSIQVVDASTYRPGDHVRARHEIRVVSMWKGPSATGGGMGSKEDDLPKDRRYLCAQNCSAMRVDEPTALNPPGNTSAPIGTTGKTIQTLPAGGENPGPGPQGYPH